MTNFGAISERALQFIHDGDVVGLGSGRTAAAFVDALAGRVAAGLRVRAVPTSEAIASQATRRGITLTTLDAVEAIDVTVDGADEVDPELNLIKGLGGALVREKIVASASRRLVILVGSEKLVQALGQRGTLPVEVVPFGVSVCRRRLAELGYPSSVRMADGRPFVSDNGNVILDCQTSEIRNPGDVEGAIRSIPGVVATGLFVGMADRVFVQDEGSVRVLTRE